MLNVIFFLIFIQYFECNQYILNSQLQEQSIYKIQNQDDIIQIWIRFQTQFIDLRNTSVLLPFAVIKDHNSVNQIILSFQPFQENIKIFIIEKDQNNTFTISNNSSQWYTIELFKQQQFEYTTLDDQKIFLDTNKNFVQSPFYGFICTWQNLTFSLKAYKQKQNQINDHLIMKNHNLVNIFRQIIMDRRDNIYIQFYFRQPYLHGNKTFLIFLDDLQMLTFILQNSTLVLINEADYFKNEVQGVGTKWNFISIQHIEQNTVIKVINDQENIIKNNLPKQNKDPNLFFGIQLVFLNTQIQIDNVLILNNYEILTTFQCYPNCIECNLTTCLKCLQNLSVDNYCLCTHLQIYDYERQVCLDISEQLQIEQSQLINNQNCLFGYYYNQDLSECLNCPQIQQFQCQECLFITDDWSQNRTCIFQEIYSIKFLELYFQHQLFDPKQVKKIQFDSNYQKITNNSLLKFDQVSGHINQQNKDIFQILETICEKGYVINTQLSKCHKLSIGTLSQSRQMFTCSQGFLQLKRECIRCPSKCKICQYVNESKQIQCLIPSKGYYLSQQFIRSCPENCPFCFNTTLCKYDIQEIAPNILQQNKRTINNCILQYGQLCLICRSSFFLDVYQNCIHRQKMVDFLNFQLIIQHSQEQFNNWQIQNLILSNKIKYNQLIFQIQIYSADFSILQSDNEEIQGCLQTQSFNSIVRCTKTSKNYQYLSTLEDVFYCPNNHCEYNLLLNVTIYISNTQLILFENKTYFNFFELFNSIKKQLIHIRQVKIMADVFVFESIGQECQDYGLFYLNYTELQQQLQQTEMKLILNFQNQAIFPECQKELIINFDYTEINFLITPSLLTIKIDSEEVKFVKCKFRQQQQQLIIMSNSVFFSNTTFMNKELQKPLIILQAYELIKDIQFINCNFGDILLENSNLMIQNQTQNFWYFKTHSQHIYILIFLSLSFLSKIINMNISQLDIRNGQFFVLPINGDQNSNCIFRLINIDNSAFITSTFIFSELQITVQLLKIRNVEIYHGKFMDFMQICQITNILFDEINSQYSIFIFTQNDLAEFTLIIVQKSVLEYGTEIIIGISSKIKMNTFKILGCDYKYNLNLFSIFADQISINQISVQMLSVYGQIYSIIFQYLIFIRGRYIKINNINFNTITLSQQKLLQISYQNLQFEKCSISSIKMKQDSELLSDLVSFIQNDKHSQSSLNQFLITEISITWTQQSVLFQFQGKQGLSTCTNFNFVNMISNSNFYLFSSSTQYIIFDNISLINVDQLGFLFQNNSYADINNFNYFSKSQFSQSVEKISPVFSNFASQFEVCKLQINNSLIGNLIQPLIILTTNGILQLSLFNVTIQDYYCKDNLISLLQYSNSSELNIIQLEHIRIINVTSPKYVVKSIGTKVFIINLLIQNSQIGLISGIFLDDLIIKNIKVMNQQHQSQDFIKSIDQQKYCILNNMLFKNQTSKNIIKIEEMDQSRYKSIIQENYFLYVKVQNFLMVKKQIQNQIIIRKINIFQAQFLIFLIILVEHTDKYNKIDNIYIQDSSIQSLFGSLDFQLIVQKIQLVNIDFQLNNTNNLIIYEDSYTYNCSFQDQQIQINNKRLNVLNNFMDQSSPIFLSFHHKKKFNQILLHSNILQVQFKNNSIVYLPTGIPINQYIYYNIMTLQQEQIYDYFAIVSNQQQDLLCNLKSSVDDQIANYTNINQFIIKNNVNIIDNFTFYMNPYQKYSYIQNDLICDNFDYILRFNVRILPCQQGEYFNQNECKICDANKFQYSVNKIAYFCNIIDINKIEQAKRGQIKLKSGYWRPQIDNSVIEFCKSELCLGGWLVGDQSCVQGQVGALCKECDIYNLRGQGRFAQNDNGCLLCDYSIQLLFKGLLVISWLIFLVYLSYDTNKQVIRQYLQFKISQRNLADILMRQSINQISVIIKICTNYAFYLYLIKDNLDFLYYQVNMSVNILSNPIQLISPQIDCMLVQFSMFNLPYLKLIYSLLTPFYILSLFYFLYMLMMYLKLTQFQFNIIMITIYSVYLYNQQLIFSSQIKLLSFVRISNINWIYFNQQYKYNTKEHYQMIVYLILPTTIIFLLIPIIIYFQLCNKDKRSIAVIKYYGILFREYKQETYYWEIIRIYVKILTIVILYMFNQQNQAFFIFLIQFYLIFVAYFSPYPLKNLNSLEQRSLVKLTWSLIVIYFMENKSKQLRATMFTIINIILLIDIINNLQQKVRLQFKESLYKVKTSILQKIPQSSRYLNVQKSIWTQENIQKIKLTLIRLKSNTVSVRSILIKNEIPLSTYNAKSEIELATFKQSDSH